MRAPWGSGTPGSAAFGSVSRLARRPRAVDAARGRARSRARRRPAWQAAAPALDAVSRSSRHRLGLAGRRSCLRGRAADGHRGLDARLETGPRAGNDGRRAASATTSGSTPAVAICARSAPRASSGIAVLALVLAEAGRAARQRRDTAARCCSTTCSRSSTTAERRSLVDVLALSAQTVVTTTSAAAFPGVPEQSLAVTPGAIR